MEDYEIPFDESQEQWCCDCKKAIVPKTIYENYGEDADGNRGELRVDFECPICGGDDLEDVDICENCDESMRKGNKFCEICEKDCDEAINFAIMELEEEFDSELINERLTKRLEE